jgi:hypothetical protein
MIHSSLTIDDLSDVATVRLRSLLQYVIEIWSLRKIYSLVCSVSVTM